MSATATIETEAAFEREFQARIERRRARRFKGLNERFIAWLALPPGWTWEAARACGFPASRQGLAAALDRAATAGLCEYAPTLRNVTLTFEYLPSRGVAPEPVLKEALLLAQEIGVAGSGTQEPDGGVGIVELAEFEPVQVRGADVLLRSEGLRVRLPRAAPVGSYIAVTVPVSDERSIRSEMVVASCRGDRDLGYEVSLLLPPDRKTPPLPPDLIYASFTMPERMRPEALIQVGQREHLESVCAQIGERLRSVDVSLPPALARWAELAEQFKEGPSHAARWLRQRTRHFINLDQTAEAMALLSTAERLSSALGGELESSLRLCNRRLELAYRQALEKRHLQAFLERPEQIEAFRALLGGPAKLWALHYFGTGGVGKTMLLRHIAGRLAAGRPVSRVDFDFLSPDYPVRRPAQLLIELADSLRVFGESEKVDEIFEEFHNRVASLHAPLSAEPPSGDPLANIHRPEFDDVLGAFCDYVQLLPQPVLLILDTCEELAKLQPSGTFQPGIEATFEVLERVHAMVPTVRVIFAGRRLLALAGPGWQLTDAAQRGHAQHLAPFKDYLRLCEIRGFDRDEAWHFLTSIKQLHISDQLFKAILARSLDTNATSEIHRVLPRELQERPTTEPDTAAIAMASEVERSWVPERLGSEERFNPFDLNLYADWLEEDPPPSVEQIASGETDPYVEMRIVGRITQADLRRALPYVALLRRFDRLMLSAAALNLGHEEFENVYRELSELEWMDYQPDESLGTTFLEVDRNLYHRLRRYYQYPTRDQPERLREFQAAKADLRPHLDALHP